MTIGHREKQKWINRIATYMNPDYEPSDTELRRIIAAEVAIRTQGSTMTVAEKSELISSLFDAMRGLDILQPLIESHDITEIMVNNPSQIYIERGGKLRKPISHLTLRRILHTSSADISDVRTNSFMSVRRSLTCD